MWFGNEKMFSKEWFKNYFLIMQGCLLTAAGYVFFLMPHKILPGGLFGIAMVFYHMFHLPAGTLATIMNIPLVLIGTRILGPQFGAKTIVGILMLAGFTDGLTYLWGNKALSDDILVSSIIGSLMVGVGVAMVFKAKATMGGIDIIGQIFYKLWKLPIGQTLMFLNIAVISTGAFFISGKHVLNLIIYAAIGSFVTSKVIDLALEGYSYFKGIFIISDKYEDIKDKILHDLKRGGTMFCGKGMYNDSDKRIIFTAVTQREIAYLKDYVKEIDPDAFVVVFNTHDIYGKGFHSVREM